MFGKSFNGLTVSRPIVAMGETLGFLPGTLEEKMRPWLQPIYDAFDVLMPPAVVPVNDGKKKKKHPANLPPAAAHAANQNGATPRKPYEHLLEQGIVEIEALAYIRGRSIPRRIFVLDEAQQLTPLEAKTVVTRMSRGSKLILVGDPAQIDNPYVDSRSNGLVYTRNRLKGEAIAAHVSLNKGERSALAEIGARLM
ncbi:MAG: PhoH family protein [Chthoniobacteraceae bacterium]